MNFTIKPTYIIGAALLLTACSQQDDMSGRTDGERRRIVFRTSLPDVASRAEVVIGKNLPYFHVTAYDHVDKDTLFSNAKINVVADKEFQSSPNCVWPEQGKESNKVSFFAFYPALEKLGNDARLSDKPTAGSLDYKLTGLSIAPDIADQVDFITAYTSGTMAENLYSGIDLPFVHQLSRIEVKAWSAHKSCNIEIAGVRIGEVNMKGTFNFKADNTSGTWSDISGKGKVEYIFREGDKIVALNKGSESTSTAAGAVSIMGNGNCAMLLPSNYPTAWDITDDRNNDNKNMYISVLLRVIDATPNAGIQPKDKQRYPYRDLSQGTDALQKGIPRVYLAVNASGIVSTRLYKKPGDYDEKDKNYYTDPGCTKRYTLKAGEEVKEFGWAALPVTAEWELGYFYAYTLDYSHGVGLHDPEVTTTNDFPTAGDPIISDIVGVNISVVEWKTPTESCDFEVTGH